MNCGCGEPDDRRDHPENLIAEDIRAAARANGQSLQKTARNILAGDRGFASEKGRARYRTARTRGLDGRTAWGPRNPRERVLTRSGR